MFADKSFMNLWCEQKQKSSNLCLWVCEPRLWLGAGESSCARGQGPPYMAGLKLLESSRSLAALQPRESCKGGFQEPRADAASACQAVSSLAAL